LSFNILQARGPAKTPGRHARYDEDEAPGGAASRVASERIIDGERKVFAAAAWSYPARRAGKQAPFHTPPTIWQRSERGEK